MSSPPQERQITLAWLVRFRWAMLAVGAVVAVVAAQTIHVLVPWATLGAIATTVAATNVVAPHLGDRPWLPAALVAVDGVALTAALAAAGGIDNPFVLAYLALIVLGSTIFGRAGGAIATGGAALGLGILVLIGQPIRLDHGHDHEETHHPAPSDSASAAGHAHGHDHAVLDERDHLRRHTEGTWAAFAVCALLVAYLIDRALRQRERHVQELMKTTRRATRLGELGAMAAQAAHELGGPLATIAVAARELEREVEGDLSQEAATIVKQVDRCREVLDELGRRARGEQAPAEAFELLALVEEAGRLVPEAALEIDVEPSTLSAFGPRQAILHVVRGLAENAHRASPSGEPVVVRARATDDRACLEIIDRGPGLEDAVRHQLGDAPVAGDGSNGLGLGVFLSRALVERVGGHLDLVDSPDGTTARLVLPTGRALG